MATYIEFSVNGIVRQVEKSTITPLTTLNFYLRHTLNLTGTKYTCEEGGCGSCVVVAYVINPRTGVKEALSVNSCTVVVYQLDGWEIVTIEGLGSRQQGYDVIQQTVVQFNATQCGWCTPGMIMSMHFLRESQQDLMANIDKSFAGNICRCTGYRPLMTAFKSMTRDANQELTGIVPDIEELSLCMKSKSKCQEKCKELCKKKPIRSLQLDIQDWYNVTTVQEIFDIFTFRGSATYNLVAGNTAKGVYKEMAFADYYIDIRAVTELRTYTLNTDMLILGANLTIAETIDIFGDVSGRDTNFLYLQKLVIHLELVATMAKRNIGTLAGNLKIKYLHNEFPSDIFLLFETVGATLVIDNGYSQEVLSPQDFLYSDMTHKVLKSIQLPPIDANVNKLETYKIMKRSLNAHAMINAGFLIKINPTGNVVQEVTIVYGGINKQFVHAVAAEGYLIGKNLFDNQNMQNLFTILNNELHPDYILPDPSPTYRKALAIALIYKFILSICPANLLTPANVSGGQKLIRDPVSTGVQDYTTNMTMYPVGEPIHKLEAADQASGEAKYITDAADIPGQTYASFVMGEAPPGSTLTALNADTALAQEGVIAFYQASDIQGVNSFMAPNTALLYQVDEPIFIPIGSKMTYFYQPVGMIVAETRAIAEAASKLVTVQFSYSSQTPYLSVSDVLDHAAFDRVHPQMTLPPSKPNLLVPYKTTGTMNCPIQYHFYMELQVANVIPTDDGGLIIHPSTQWLDAVQYSVSRSSKIKASSVACSAKRIGGAYGGKITRNNHPACAAALAALKLNRPVKFHIHLIPNMNVIGKRNASYSNYTVGYDNTGLIGYLNNDIYNNLGAYGNALNDLYMLDLYMNTYISDGYLTDTYWVRTDVPAATYMRAPGSLEGGAFIQCIMEHIAYNLKKDPLDVRMKNLNGVKYPLLLKICNDCLLWSNYTSRRADVETFNANNRWRKRGISMVPMVYDLLFLSPHYVQVSVYQADGSVSITHGGIENGQGLNTKVAQVAAFLLGIDMSQITIRPTNDFVSPNNMCTAGSITSEAIIIALKRACTNLKFRIDTAATQAKLPLDTPWVTKVKNAGTAMISLTENQMFADDPSNSANYPVFGAAVAEVEVDILTGIYVILRVDLMEDAGDSLNPAIDIGQIEGAFIQGMGNWTTEEIIYNPINGQLMTNDTWTYKPPVATDIPVDFRVKIPSGNPNLMSPFRNKGTGEPAVCLAITVPFAIRQAIASARLNANINNDPFVTINGPTTPEFTFLNCLNDYKQYKL